MSTFTIRVTSSATNTTGTAYGEQPDLGTPSFLDMIVTDSSTDSPLPDGVYDAYCLDVHAPIFLSPTTYVSTGYAGNDDTTKTYLQPPLTPYTLTQDKIDQLNWLLSQNFTSDSKYAGQFCYGEVQTAIWRIVGFTPAEIVDGGYELFLSDNNRQVVSDSDVEFLILAAQLAIASGYDLLPSDAFYSMVIDPAGDAQPLITQLQSAKLGNYVWLDADKDGIQDGDEAGVNGVTVNLYDGADNLIASTITGDDYSTAAVEQGYYQFTGLKAGNYQVKFIAPTDHVFTLQNATVDTSDSDADKNGLSQVITLTAGESNQTIDAGLLGKSQQNSIPASLSGYVYQDEGNDGAWDGVAAGIGNVTVTLLDANGNPVLDLNNNPIITTTDANGFYEFTDLEPGTYGVSELQPNDYLDGKDTAGVPGTGIAENDIITGIILAEGQSSRNNNFGELKPASVSGFVYVDNSDDGIKDGGEPGISGVTITLTGTDDLGVPVSLTTITTADGSYSFNDLRPGIYTVTETNQPFDYLDGKDTAGVPGSGVAGNDVISNIVLNAGDSSTNNNFGELPQPAQLSGYVYVDTDNDGVKDTGENPLAGIIVNLTGSDTFGRPVNKTATTDENGFYQFTDLAAGIYSVVESQPTDYLDGKDTAGSTGGNNSVNDTLSGIVLNAGDNSENNNFGELPQPAQLSGYVYVDTDNDGIKDAGENPLAGIIVNLTGSDTFGRPVNKTATTDENGFYQFTDLAAGIYSVVESQPTDYLDGKDSVGSTGGNNSVNDTLSGIVLNAGDNSENNNFGELPQPAQLSGYVYEDAGDDGIKGATEVAIDQVTVTLFNAAGVEVASTVTDSDGHYAFTGLVAGTYTVVESQPTDYLDGKDTAGNDAIVDGDDRIAVTLNAGDNSENNNFGELPPPPANVGVDIEKYVRGSYETTISGGATEGFSPGFWKTHACTVDVKDWEATGYAKGDSVEVIFNISLFGTPSLLDALSAGGGGVNALLRQSVAGLLNASNPNVDYKYTAAEVIQMTQTAVSTGNYSATQSLLETENSKEGDLNTPRSGGSSTTVETPDADADDAPGIALELGNTAIFTYVVKNTGDVELNAVQVTDDKIATLNFVGGDTDGDGQLDVTETWTYSARETVITTGLHTNVGTVTAEGAGKTVTDTDAANYTVTTVTPPPPVNNASLGDKVWLDKDGDGKQDSGEAGVAGVSVTLISGGADGLMRTTSDNTTQTMVTDANGNYSFTGLAAGEYQVDFEAGSGYALTQQNAGRDDAKDSDANRTTGLSQVVSLAAGQSNLTIDAGLTAVCPPPVNNASVGDKVWDDMNHNNIQDSSEPGIANIRITLTGAGVDGNFGTTDDVTQNTTTDSNGNYLFSNLAAGDYKLTFDKGGVMHYNYGAWYNMSNWKWAVKDAYSNSKDTLDSDVAGDAKATTDITTTSVFTLAAGQNDMTKDAGITPIVIDLNGDGIHTVARTGLSATFDLFGNGSAIQSGWLSGDDGFLAIDRNGNGKIDDISELFGGLKKGDGFAKLSSFDSTGNGIVDAADVDFASLSIWQDINGNHATDDGELFSLAAAGIVSLKTSFTETPFLDLQGNVLLERSSATLANAQEVDMTDVYFNVSAADAAAAGIEVTGLYSLLGY